MDEYSTKQHDIAQLKFLCESLYDQGIATLGDSQRGWVNDPTSSDNLQLNDLIEHIASFVISFKIKYMDENDLSALVEEYLDDTYTVFSSFSINNADLHRWQETKMRTFRMLSGESICTTIKT
ncbi:Hha toxicity modulator TomB [Serratia sp. DD3]|uniref:Hha toxicity modulator TomB n=1 Tax=Serratia sp. DD3 TaxID=1410619 RepID=UPI0003C4F50D|nr:Hha toxicity modulator TomB [Serratia sp. DD3]KEY60536.1 Hha toxicity modulator TomB [Serratia sp. DD3]